MSEIENDEASTEREQQRSESEARDIIHDVDRLYSLSEEKRTRWIWELLQNAKDVSPPEGTAIEIRLTPEKLEFKHNGLPFKTKHLLAILYKTSTKSLNGEGGTTGKYGTGFVTTHILNKKLSISGVHINDRGERYFDIEIDRTPALLSEDKALAEMQKSLKNTFISISELTKSPAVNIENRWNTFTYILKPDSYTYAERGIEELKRNLAFLLLINPKIKSVVIITPNSENTYVGKDIETTFGDIRFISLGAKNGLLYKKSGKLTFGIPAYKEDDTFQLMPIVNQAILFKEFPLIGTEGFNLPVFLQHEDFHPTELRDAIRTKLSSDCESDPTAEKNRTALTEFTTSYLSFLKDLIDARLEGTYLFAKSGLPEFINVFSDPTWYSDKIQTPIRNAVLEKNIVATFSGAPKRISEVKFILNDFEFSEAFFDLASKMIPEQIPDTRSIWQWAEIIVQTPERWPSDIILKIEDFLKLIPVNIKLDADDSFGWLKKLYCFLVDSELIHLGEKYPIYPNEAGDFCVKAEVSVHPNIDNEFKLVSRGLGRPLEKEFLDKRVGNQSAIKVFDLTDFYKQLNSDLIGDLKVESALDEEVKAVFHVCCLFRSDRAFRREAWFKIINQLLPILAPEKKTIYVDYENYGRSAELWTIKYICMLIEKAGKPSVFALEYFEGHLESCFEWLSEFISFAFGLGEDSKELILKRNIIPVQSDDFRPYDDFIFSEQDSKFFTDTLKDIYKNHTQKGDPRRFIVDTKLTADGVRPKEAEVLTKEIDKLFLDENIESKVRKGGNLNEMFLQLNDWFESSASATSFLPTFAGKRASLYVLALGEGFSKQIMEIRSTGKSMEDITELAKIQLSVAEMKLLENAANELGTEQLLAKAQEMLDAKLQIQRWKTIGTAAEKAFTDALSFTQPDFQILNPDIGKDFVIVANGKEYAIEIKSVDPNKGNVNMSLLQGATAVIEKDCYALCVLSRPADNKPVDKEYFISESRFVPDIGYQIGNSIDRWNMGIRDLDTNQEVKVAFDEKSESVYVNRNIWKSGITFDELCNILTVHFK